MFLTQYAVFDMDELPVSYLQDGQMDNSHPVPIAL